MTQLEDHQEGDMLDPIPEPIHVSFSDGWGLDMNRVGDDFIELDWTPSGSQRTTLDVMYLWEAEDLRDALTALLDREVAIMPKPTDSEETK